MVGETTIIDCCLYVRIACFFLRNGSNYSSIPAIAYLALCRFSIYQIIEDSLLPSILPNMATEIFICPLKDGRVPDDANSIPGQVLKDTLSTLTDQEGFQRAYWGREVENPGTFRLFVDWDSIDAHTKFTKAEYAPSASHLYPDPVQPADTPPLVTTNPSWTALVRSLNSTKLNSITPT